MQIKKETRVLWTQFVLMQKKVALILPYPNPT